MSRSKLLGSDRPLSPQASFRRIDARPTLRTPSAFLLRRLDQCVGWATPGEAGTAQSTQLGFDEATRLRARIGRPSSGAAQVVGR